MMTCLLALAGRPKGRGIRPNSLKVTTISTLMTDGAKGKSNLSQLSIQGNYRAVAPRDVDKVYSRNMATQQLFGPKFAQNDPQENKSAESIV